MMLNISVFLFHLFFCLAQCCKYNCEKRLGFSFKNNVRKGIVFTGNLISAYGVIQSARADAQESIARTAAKIPGFGPKDVVYPRVFEGKWLVKQNYTNIEITDKNTRIPRLVTKIKPNLVVKFERSYFTYQEEVLLDRQKNAKQLYSILFGDKYARGQWDPANANVLTVTTSDNILEEVRVTKRSVEDNTSVKNAVGYSEYARITEADIGLQTVPYFFSHRLLARYKYVEATDTILGLERTYYYPGESLDLGGEQPIAVVKSKVEMTRVLPLA